MCVVVAVVAVVIAAVIFVAAAAVVGAVFVAGAAIAIAILEASALTIGGVNVHVVESAAAAPAELLFGGPFVRRASRPPQRSQPPACC